jgi:hypothetical protein
MTKQDLATIIVRILAIYCFVRGIYTTAPAVQRYLEGSPVAEDFLMMAMSQTPQGILLLLAAVLLVMSAPKFGRLLMSDGDEIVNLPCSTQQVQAIAFSIIGLYLMAAHLPPILVGRGGPLSEPLGILSGYYPGLMNTDLLLLLFGLWLFLGSRGLRRLPRMVPASALLKRVRGFGQYSD